MCGVIGLIWGSIRDDMGLTATDLLKTLEYRGYDSTGAAVQAEGTDIRLVKGVGAPSVMVHRLGINEMRGQILCGQVRWATFGAVTRANSQPHHVRCKIEIYGAHNGNVTNCDDLKVWLTDEGHEVLSDNDGEMVVHTVEHYFAQELASISARAQVDPDERRRCMRAAILSAGQKLKGSFAAVVVDPVSRIVWAIKMGSSLYFGMGRRQDDGDPFGIASSDLSSVLKLTRVVVPLQEGEFIEYDAKTYQIYRLCDRAAKGDRPALKAGACVERRPSRSRLQADDIALNAPFETFMDQEISAQPGNSQDVIDLFNGGSAAATELGPLLDARPDEDRAALFACLDQVRQQYSDARMARSFYKLADSPEMQGLVKSLSAEQRRRCGEGSEVQLVAKLASAERGFFADMLDMARGVDDVLAVRLLDAAMERDEIDEFNGQVDRFVDLCYAARSGGGTIHVVSCGSSYNAAQAAALFFNEIAHTELNPILPGEFRGQHARSLRDGDLFIAVSQSGETKDLIDVMNDVINSGRQVGRIAIVNNVNSTLAQEKSEVVIPLRCGAEIAVPATKSFINQMVVFYCLALKLGERVVRDTPAGVERVAMLENIERRRAKLHTLPALIQETISGSDAALEEAAQVLYLCPSIHLLATRIRAVASEGALKIREVVLNHTEGFEGSEFKHGPNTILGFNTVFGPIQVDAMLKKLGQTLDQLTGAALKHGLGVESVRRLIQAVTDSVFSPRATPGAPFSLEGDERALFERFVDRGALFGELYHDYPLIYVTGPDQRDVNLTVSQINTHKIRGSVTVVIAEEHAALRQAAGKAPVDNPGYRSVFVPLPRTNDTLMAVFSSTVAIQRLALKMSLLKMNYLDRLGVPDHGVHPDVPKNVSKSITVD